MMEAIYDNEVAPVSPWAWPVPPRKGYRAPQDANGMWMTACKNYPPRPAMAEILQKRRPDFFGQPTHWDVLDSTTRHNHVMWSEPLSERRDAIYPPTIPKRVHKRGQWNPNPYPKVRFNYMMVHSNEPQLYTIGRLV